MFILALSSALPAATNIWVGDTDNDFQNPLNWTDDGYPNPATDTFRFDSVGLQGNPVITNVTVALTNTGTSPGTNLGQILFSGGAPALTLGGGTISLPAGTHNNAIVLSSGSAVTQTIASNIVIGDGAAATSSIVNNSVTEGGLLKVTGGIAGGTGAGTPGQITFSFGNTSSHNGNYEVTGAIAPGGAGSIVLVKRGSGTLALSGDNTVGNGNQAGFGNNEAGSTIRIAGGTTALNNGTDAHWGGNNIAAPLVPGNYQISGGTLNAQSARNLRSNLVIDGGTLNVGSAGIGTGRISLDLTTSDKTFTMTAGAVNFLPDQNVTTNNGVRFGGDSGAGSVVPTNANYGFTGTQSGGDFVVYGRGGNNSQTFSLGNSSGAGTADTISYALSGGVLDLRGGAGNTAALAIGADITGVKTTTFTLSGTGKLIVRADSTWGVYGAQADASAKQVFALLGGTLAAGRVDATNLRGSVGGANGTLVNNGATIAPGDTGSTGRTQVTGNLDIASGALAIDLGGTAASTVWQDGIAGSHDVVNVVGTADLGGTLSVALVAGYTPLNTDVLTILTSGGLTGAFSNVAFGARVTTAGNEGSFLVSQSGNDVTLSDYQSSGGPTPVAPVLTVTPVGNDVQIAFLSVDGLNYQVEYSTNSLSGWTNLPGGAVAGDGTVKTITHTNGKPAAGGSVFYRAQAN